MYLVTWWDSDENCRKTLCFKHRQTAEKYCERLCEQKCLWVCLSKVLKEHENYEEAV